MFHLPLDGSLDDEEEKEEQESDISEKQRHQLKHRELFLSRQVETLPATHIRGKCVVTLLNETESLTSYLNKEVRIKTVLIKSRVERKTMVTQTYF